MTVVGPLLTAVAIFFVPLLEAVVVVSVVAVDVLA